MKTESAPHSVDPWFDEAYRSGLMADSKFAADSIPRRHRAEIAEAYSAAKQAAPAFDVLRFLSEHYILPRRPQVRNQAVEAYLRSLWVLLRHEPNEPVSGSSLLPLPYPYVVPGGRFRELYYWDSYFTMLGLRESGEEGLVESMVKNFAWQIGRHGFIPNGNRTYYLTRSQPPYFALMVELLAETQGPKVYGEYREALQQEHAFWMDATLPTAHVVHLPGGAVLNRYCDQSDAPRAEAYWADLATAKRSAQPAAELFRNIRSAAESGWDFSSRWFADGKSMETIETTALVPVDLNCLLHRLEIVLARAHRIAGDSAGADRMVTAAGLREQAIQRFCWSADAGFFCDYHREEGLARPRLTLAGVAPLFFGFATDDQAREVARILETRFLQPGGLTTTLEVTGQQWDAPNGWAPLHWLAIQGLERYGHHRLAREIARRWIAVNLEVFAETGLFWEKYNVVDLHRQTNHGEYPSQVGFGWTNAVLLKLLRQYDGAES